jgi:hypothetical protein
MSETCRHSSRVGTRMRAYVPSARLTWGSCAARSAMMGARYASVFPEPVGAFTSASLPLCAHDAAVSSLRLLLGRLGLLWLAASHATAGWRRQ